MTTKKNYSGEIDVVSADRIKRASRTLGDRGYDLAEYRYSFYRRKGYSPTEAVRYVLAWARNMSEQRANRLGHETGAVDWI